MAAAAAAEAKGRRPLALASRRWRLASAATPSSVVVDADVDVAVAEEDATRRLRPAASKQRAAAAALGGGMIAAAAAAAAPLRLLLLLLAGRAPPTRDIAPRWSGRRPRVRSRTRAPWGWGRASVRCLRDGRARAAQRIQMLQAFDERDVWGVDFGVQGARELPSDFTVDVRVGVIQGLGVVVCVSGEFWRGGGRSSNGGFLRGACSLSPLSHSPLFSESPAPTNASSTTPHTKATPISLSHTASHTTHPSKCLPPSTEPSTACLSRAREKKREV